MYSLYNGKGNQFWKTWKGKVCGSEKAKVNIEGASADISASEIFKLHFEKACSTVDIDYEKCMQQKFNELLNIRRRNNTLYYNNYLDRSVFNAMLIDMAVSKLNNSTAVGVDHLQKQHLIYAHPMLYSILAKLFYFMLAISYVPDQFGNGIVIPIQKDTGIRGIQKPDNFRGISINPLLSKVFEYCVLFIFGKYLTTNDRQFGFKESSGCTHAIFTVRNVIDFYVNNNSTVNISCIDVSKAFDKMSHSCLFFKLLEKSVPTCLIFLLRNWYSKLSSIVCHENVFSSEFKNKCGVRQGGVLSPILFSVYVDNVLKSLSNLGCTMNGISYGSIMYADDLLLAAPSIRELRQMITICCNELDAINLTINTKKSCWLRIGPRFSLECESISCKYGTIPQVTETRYLGIYLIAGKVFKVSFVHAKCNFYSSFNALYSKMGNVLNINVIVHLLTTISLPMLTYGIESLTLNKSTLNNLENTFNRALYKIFKVSDAGSMHVCKEMFGIRSITELYYAKLNNFKEKLNSSNNNILKNLLASS